MKYKKGLIFICLIICLFSIAIVSATDVNETIVTSEDQNDELITIDESLSSEVCETSDKEIKSLNENDVNYNGSLKSSNESYILENGKTNTHIISTEEIHPNDHISIEDDSNNGISGVNVTFDVYNGENTILKSFTFQSGVWGTVEVIASDISAGEYTTNISFAGNTQYNPTSKIVKLIVLDHSEKINAQIISSDEIHPNDFVTVKDISNNSIPNAKLTFNVYRNNENDILKSNTITSDANGLVKVIINGLPDGLYDTNISFAGNAQYNPTYKLVKLIIGNYIPEPNGDGNNSVTFTDLANDIANAGDELNLTRDYIYSSSDSIYKDGVNINKKITINGNGFIIDGNNQARALKVYNSNVVLKNIYFVNCSVLSSNSDVYGGAVYWSGVNGILSNCSFINCSASSSSSSAYSYSRGGAVYWRGENGTLSNCSFMNCSALASDFSSPSFSDGGAIYWNGVNGTLSNCSFMNCSALTFSSSSSFTNGGAVFWIAYYGVLNNCSFINCSAEYNGGAVYLDSFYSILSNCSFINCSNSTSGGAIGWFGSNNVLCNCIFVNCSSSSGGAIFSGGPNNNVMFNCSFMNCSAKYHGGAVDWCTDNIALFNCSFMNCFCFVSSSSSDCGGGAVYWYGKKGTLSNCSFLNCFVSSSSSYSGGGAVYWRGVDGTLSNCSFMNCSYYSSSSYSYVGGSAVYWSGDGGYLFNCTFTKCNSKFNEGVVLWLGNSGIIIDSNFVNCSDFNIYLKNENVQIENCNCSANNNHSITFKSYIHVQVVDTIDFGKVVTLKMDIIYGATGKIDIYVNDTFKKTVRVGSSAYLNDLNVGLNVIKVVYRGDDYFESSENITTVIVNKVNSSITFNNDIVFNYGSSGSTLMTVNGVTDINAFVINHTEAIVKVKNNRITVANLDIGNYTLVAITIPDDNHYSVNTTANIIVNKLESQISIPTIIFNYNGSTTVNANVVGVTDIINVKVENHQEAMIYVYGTEITVSNLDAGNYTLVATTVPDKNYKSVNTTALIIVNKINSTINFTNDLVFDYGSSDYTIVNIEYATNITNIKVKNHPEAIIYADNNIITVSGLNAGSYTLSATTVPDKNHNAVTGTTKITVNKINSTLNVDDEIIFNYGDSGIANAEYNGATAINAYVTDIIDPNVIHGGITIDGKNITISYLNAGEYLLHVYTIPDNNHYSVSNVAKITVNKANPIITLSPIIFDYGGTGLTKLITNDNIDFNATVVNHQDALINIEDKKIWVSNLEAGNYILKVNTYSNENYNAFNLNTNITVNKIDSFVSASDIIFDYGFYGSTKFDLDGAININASIINHTEAIVGIVNNEIYISSLNAGTYYLNITTIPDDNHKSVTIIPLVTVNKVNSSIFIPTIVFDYDDSTTVSPILDGVAKITYAFVTNHKEALVEISDNNEITVSGLNAGRYMLVVTTEPDDNHNPISSVTADIVVNKIDSTIFIPEINFNYGLYGSTKVILSGATKFKANIDGDTTHLSINDDVIVIFGLNAGTYDLTVTTVPDTNHNAVNSVSKIIVNKLGTVLTSSDVTGVYGTSKNLIVKLNDVNGNLLVGESITVNLNNVMYSGHIGSNGQVIINIPSYLPAKSYVATITYGGNTNHEKSTSTIKITVKKATPKLTAKSKTFKKSVKTKKYTMTLKDNQNKAMKNAKVTIKINKKTYTAKTNSKGVATFKIKKLTKKGTFKSKVTYKGDKCYNKITKTVKIKVK